MAALEPPALTWLCHRLLIKCWEKGQVQPSISPLFLSGPSPPHDACMFLIGPGGLMVAQQRPRAPYRAIPFRDSIAEGGVAPICLVFIGYRASIAEIPLLRGGYRTSTSHALQGGNAQKRGRGYRTQLAMLRHQKPHSAR